MNADEREVCDYLKSWPRQFVSGREVARRAGGKRRFREDPQWANNVLTRLLEQGIIETDGLGHYRLKGMGEDKKRNKKWIAPHLRRILEGSSKDFADALDISDDGENSPKK